MRASLAVPCNLFETFNTTLATDTVYGEYSLLDRKIFLSLEPHRFISVSVLEIM